VRLVCYALYVVLCLIVYVTHFVVLCLILNVTHFVVLCLIVYVTHFILFCSLKLLVLQERCEFGGYYK
jgi:hypothetical protein